MTGKGDRTHVETPYDRTRGNVALARLGNALGVKLDAKLPDHVLLERLAEAADALRSSIAPLCTEYSDGKHRFEDGECKGCGVEE